MKFKKHFQRIKILAGLLIIVGLGCKPSSKNQNEKFSAHFQQILDSELNDSIPGILLNVTAPKFGIDWSGASGLNDWFQSVPLQADQTFRIASVTKTYVAAAVLRLWEDKKLSLDDYITKYISVEHAAILEKGGYIPSQITIRHLLSHTSGLGDHTNSNKFTVDFLKNRHVWTRTETLVDLVTLMKPAGDIGTQFSYSDTGYVLLGEIIETITGLSMGDAILE
ncbi:MAG: serine hydrolase domain-containing protein, partial [Tenuifilaceae bacterium]|nr:serine hydrolase domain-containing protein [Tenuifilaceae bacterium]